VASRRFRAKSSLNSNLSQVNARVSQITKRPAPRRIADNAITSLSIKDSSIVAQNLSDGSVTSAKLAADAVKTGNIADKSVTTAKLADGTIPVVANLDASVITTGSFAEARIPNLPASKITSGTFSASVIGDLPASKITSETFDAARIPNLDTSKITSGVFDAARIPAVSVSNLDASVITSGTFSTSRIPTITNSMIGSGAISGTQGSVTSKIESNSIGQGDIGPDSIGPSELIESGSFTMAGLDINGNLQMSGTTRIFSSGAMTPTTVSTSGGVTLRQDGSGGAIFRLASSRRYKLDEQLLDTGLLALQLQPKTWVDKLQYEDNGNSTEGLRRYPGFIAEDLEELGLELFVSYDTETGAVEGINYGELMATIIPVLKHQQEKIESLEARLNLLEEQAGNA
jgi:hypothetical protein